jgi:hypothetical protein
MADVSGEFFSYTEVVKNEIEANTGAWECVS